MKISSKWLCELVEGLDKIAPADLAKKLTMSGLEVEEYIDQKQKWQGLIVGEVKTREQHPNADKLSLCQVFDGQQTFQVVCGAPNVTAGKKYPFATLGTVMPSGLKIAPVKLRGLESLGMLCSAKELELSDESNGLLELPQDAETGQALSEALLQDDVIMTLNVTPNRGDALSHWGVAKDVAALTGLKANFKKIAPVAIATPVSAAAAQALQIDVQDASGCPRYSASQIQGVKVRSSPAWLKNRLQALGQRSINNVVDATNYVMLLTGHPVHAFDARNIHDGKLVVQSLQAPLSYKTLDETERALLAGDLVIADGQGPVALAGIMGGLTSAVKDDTENLILEVAFFEPNQIRRTSRGIGLQTDSSYRFARFVNPETVLIAHQILQQLLVAVAGGQASAIQDFYPNPLKPIDIELAASEWRRILGIEIPKVEVAKTLTGLSFGITETENGFVVQVPVGRSDIMRPIDLIEEIGRIHGLDQIPAEMPRLLLRTPEQSPIYNIDQELKTWMVDQGFNETIHLSFGDEKLFAQVGKSSEANVVLKNPISEDLKIMRPTLLAHLLSCLKKNTLNSEAGLKFFEMRKVYHKTKDGHSENYRLCAVYAGNPHGRNRFGLQQNLDFYHGKGLLENLQNQIAVVLQPQIHTDYPYHPGQALAFHHDGAARLWVGAVHPEVLQKFKIKDKVFAIEMDLDWLTKHYQTKTSRFQPVSTLPYVYRDMALLVDKQLTYDKIRAVIQRHKPIELTQVHLFDLFQGDSLPEGKMSMAFSMVYEAKAETQTTGSAASQPVTSLNDEVVNAKHFALVEALQNELGVQLR